VLPRKPGAAARARWIESEPRSVGAEALRDLYCSLRLRLHERTQRVVLVTSAVGGEGKSLVAANLARCCARHGERTLLIDSDLRRPAQASWLGPDASANSAGGLAALAAGARPLEELVRPGGAPRLDVLVDGGPVERASALLSSPLFRDLILQARQRYDRIILDAPPIGAVSDAAILLEIADGCLVVVRQGRTRLKTVETAVERLAAGTTPVLGFVLNRTRSTGRSRHIAYLASSGEFPVSATPARAG
jgi:capsular exopolysaccharide synthesis family protein